MTGVAERKICQAATCSCNILNEQPNEKDRIRKETLLASSKHRPTTRSLSRHSDCIKEATRSSSCENPTSASNYSFTFSPSHRPSERSISKKSPINNATPLEISTENRFSTQNHTTQRLEDSRKHGQSMQENNDTTRRGLQSRKRNYGRFDSQKIHHMDRTEIPEPNNNDANVKIDSSRSTERRNHATFKTNNHRSEGQTQIPSEKHIHEDNTFELRETHTSGFRTSLRHGEWSNTQNRTSKNIFEGHTSVDFLPDTSTPRIEEESEFPNLSLSTIAFSYKSPPARRKPRKGNPEKMIWTEEQKYLQFISGVTSDVLARGICSNRVINKVFESHIEKRKEDLDENNLREMINQLKDDLGITED